MVFDEIEAGITLVERLSVLIPTWIARAKAAGELTEEQEAAYNLRQEAVFGKPYAQPEAESPTPAPTGDPPASPT